MLLSVVDAFPFPWNMPEAREFHAALCDIYPSSRGAMFIAVSVGLNPATLYEEQPSYLLWRDILDAGATASKNRELVKLVLDKNPTNPRRAFLSALLAAQPTSIPIDFQPRGADLAPVFLKAGDGVTEPEALLFHDDLTLPIGRIDWLVSVLRRLETLGPAICRLEASFHSSSKGGTGFRISPDFILTNWHVLHLGDTPALGVVAEFGYDDDGRGGTRASTALQCNPSTIRGQAAYDWAIIALAGSLADTFPAIRLSDANEPVEGASAFVIQHPGGSRKRVAYVRNQITYFDDVVVHYLTDTQPGSSGSPVLDEYGRLVALHHAGGRPQEIAGKPPLRKNEGIRISRVRNGLAALGVVGP